MTGDLYINGKDAYLEWGMSLDDTAVSTLMKPAPNKPYIENKSRLEHGKRVSTKNAKKAERTISLGINFTAANEEQFLSRYDAFCTEMEKGDVEIKTIHKPNTVYRTVYKDCSQYSQFVRRLAKCILMLEEPNPHNRSL